MLRRSRPTLGLSARRVLRGYSVSEDSLRLAVKAYYVARSIDVSRLYERADPGVLRQHRVGRESVMLTLASSEAAEISEHTEVLEQKRRAAWDETLSPWRGHVVIFSYGSVVFFNVSKNAQRECLQLVVPFCKEAIPEGFQPTEDYSVIQRSMNNSGTNISSALNKKNKIQSSLTATSRAAATQREPAGTLRAAGTRREPSALLSSSLASAKVVRRRRDGLLVHASTAIDPQLNAMLRLSKEIAILQSEKKNHNHQSRNENTIKSSSLSQANEEDIEHQSMTNEENINSAPATEIGFDAVVLPRLDVHNISVIATVMAQTVALDHYSVKVDAMLATFSRLNSNVEKTGIFDSLEKNNLFKLVALNNTLFTDVIAKIGLLERSETAWRNLEYTQIWEGLRDEFEVEDRFEKIEFKLNLVQLNTKFFLEILANQKSKTLEWIIIVLISLEIVVGTCDLCGIQPLIRHSYHLLLLIRR